MLFPLQLKWRWELTGRHGKRQFFTDTWFESKIFYPKKCVNYNKSNLQQNSVKGPKDPNSEKKMSKIKKKVTKCAKNATKAQHREITHFVDKTAYNFAKILPKIGLLYTNIVGTLVSFPISVY